METINDSNYELWLVLYADGELSSAERKDVERWLEEHPEAAEELALYSEAPRLERDENVHYTATTQPHTRPLWGGVWRWTAAAAVALLLLTPLALRLFAGSEEPVQVAQATPPVGTPRVAAAADSAILVVADKPHTDKSLANNVIPDESLATAVRRVATDTLLVADATPTVEVPSAAAAADSTILMVADTPLADEPMADIAISDEPLADTARRVPTDTLLAATDVTIEEEDTLDYVEQRLLALADGTREGLKGTYLGRRLARRLPENRELLAQVEEARERTPRGIRVVTDLVVKLIEVNSKENNQQNSITL